MAKLMGSNIARRKNQTKRTKRKLYSTGGNMRANIVEVPSTAVIFYVFGEINDKGIIKVGWTENTVSLRKRKNDLENERFDGLLELKDLAFVHIQNQADETTVKEAFKYAQAYEKKTEFFKVDEQIIGWLRMLRCQSYCYHTIDEIDGSRGYVTNSEAWLPNIHKPSFFGRIMQSHTPDWGELNQDVIMEGDYYTPPDLIKLVHEKFWPEGIDLDPASCNAANRGVGGYAGIKAKQIYMAGDDGCTQPWLAERVWLNPPFSQWNRWGPKVLKELDCGNIKEILIIFPDNAISNANGNRLLDRADAILFPRQRMKFWGPKAQMPPNANMLMYIGPNRDRFKEVFGHVGAIKFG